MGPIFAAFDKAISRQVNMAAVRGIDVQRRSSSCAEDGRSSVATMATCGGSDPEAEHEVVGQSLLLLLRNADAEAPALPHPLV
jgi:hypothetical protein